MTTKEVAKIETNQPSTQADVGYTYKSNKIFELIPNSTLDLLFFKKLYSVLKGSTDESADHDIAKLVPQPDKTQEEFDGLKKYAKSLYKVVIHIYGARGEYIFTENEGIFDDPSLPDRINRVVFENSTRFKTFTQREPVNQFRIIFDFTAPPIIDFNISPSIATPINSSIDIVGENTTWVSGTYKKIVELLENRKNTHGWLHRNNIWDLFLWAAIMPIIFRILFLLQKASPASISNLSGVLKAAIYVYVFFFLLNIFRILFGYARWVFPYLELNTPLKKTNLHRIVLGAIVFSIVGTMGYELVMWCVKALWG